jgi:hypothetical protein
MVAMVTAVMYAAAVWVDLRAARSVVRDVPSESGPMSACLPAMIAGSARGPAQWRPGDTCRCSSVQMRELWSRTVMSK